MPGEIAQAASTMRPDRFAKACVFGQLLAVALLILGAKLVLIAAFGSDLPFWDQWDAEGRSLLMPYLERGLAAIPWFAPHSVHHIFTTRVFALGLFVANGQWDALVECCFSAIVHVACAICLAAFVGRELTNRRFRSVFLAIIVLGFASPYGWSNTLGGFQVQFYFAMLATLTMLCLASRPDKGPMTCCLIAALAALSYFSLASGVFCCLAGVFCIALVRGSAVTRRPTRPELVCICALTLMAISGYAFTPAAEDVPAEHLRSGFVRALHHVLSFPTSAGALIVWAPCAILLVRSVRAPSRITRLVAFDLGLAAFVFMIAVGIASQRGDDVGSRYTDLLWLGLFANVLAAHELVLSRSTGNSRAATVAFVVYAAVISTLVADTGLNAVAQARLHKSRIEEETARLKRFLASGVPAALDGIPSSESRYPFPTGLASLLRDPALRAVLPPSLRRGVLEEDEGFVANGFTSPGIDPLQAAARSITYGTYDPIGGAGPASLTSDVLSLHPSMRLRIDAIGSVAPDDVTIEVVDAGGQRRPARLRGMDRHHWTSFALPAPSTPFVLSVTVRPQRPGDWFGFAGPVEVGRLRPFCDFLMDHAVELLAAGLGLFVALLAFDPCTRDDASSRIRLKGAASQR